MGNGIKMKSIYLSCTKLWVYLTVIPPLIIFRLALAFNKHSTGILKFYPLMIVSALAVIFIVVYFFRVISINNDEIRYHGLFSSRDSSVINENKTLVMTLLPRRKIRLELFGDAGEKPAFDWMKSTDVAHRDICLFRGRAVGGKKTIAKILKYFGVSDEEAARADHDGFYFENDVIRVDSKTENETFKVSLNFKITII